MLKCPRMAHIVNTNISLEHDFWMRCKMVALKRGISLNQLVKNGLALALGDDDVISIDEHGRVSNDLRGVFPNKPKKKPTKPAKT